MLWQSSRDPWSRRHSGTPALVFQLQVPRWCGWARRDLGTSAVDVMTRALWSSSSCGNFETPNSWGTSLVPRNAWKNARKTYHLIGGTDCSNVDFSGTHCKIWSISRLVHVFGSQPSNSCNCSAVLLPTVHEKLCKNNDTLRRNLIRPLKAERHFQTSLDETMMKLSYNWKEPKWSTKRSPYWKSSWNPEGPVMNPQRNCAGKKNT